MNIGNKDVKLGIFFAISCMFIVTLMFRAFSDSHNVRDTRYWIFCQYLIRR